MLSIDRKLLSCDYQWASIRVIVVIHVFIISDCQYHLYKIYHLHNSKGFPIDLQPLTLVGGSVILPTGLTGH